VRFAYRVRDPVSHRWVKARYVAERHVIAARYSEWEIAGPPEVRTDTGAAFNPWKRDNY
jgi:hypothetical protein